MNKICTSIEQSKKLLELGININTADMIYQPIMDIDSMSNVGFAKIPLYFPFNETKECNIQYLPCWSLAALLDVLPNDWWGYNKHYFLEISKMGDMSAPYIVSYFRFREQYDGANFDRITHISYQSDNPVDACVEMILKLHELKML